MLLRSSQEWRQRAIKANISWKIPPGTMYAPVLKTDDGLGVPLPPPVNPVMTVAALVGLPTSS